MLIKRAWIALLLSLSLFSLVQSVAAQQQQNFTVVDVEVEGNRAASRSLILGVSSFDIGSPLTPTDIAETVRRLYGLGIFSDVRIDAEPVTGGLKVYIVVKELPKLSGLDFSGNKEIKSSDLKEKLALGVGGYISPYLIEQKQNDIKDLYAKKGYFRAVVTPSLEYSADSTEAILTYKIRERSKVKVEKVEMTGNKRIEASDVIGVMRNRHRGFLKSSDFAQDKYEEDLQKVIDEFHKKGFIDAYLISDSMSIDTLRDRMTIYLNVYEGPEYYFGDATFTSNKELSSDKLQKTLKYKKGDIFDSDDYDKTLEEIYSAYYDIGYLHLRVLDQKSTVQDSIINVSYDITEGLPSSVNLVRIVGNTKTRDKVIRREVTTFPGDRFSRASLIRSVRDVMALNYFANVTPTPVNLPNGDVDVEFKVEEKQTGQISAGAGYNSQDKLVGNLGLGIPNFRGMGQSINFNTDFGSRRNSFSLSFTEPWMFGRPTLFGTELYTLNQQWYTDYTESRQGASMRVGRRLRWPDNYFRVYGSYRLERDKYHDFDSTFVLNNSYVVRHIGPYDANLARTYYDVTRPYPGSILNYADKWHAASRISFTISRDSRNLPEFATKGSQISYTFEKTGGILGGYWNYTHHDVTLAKFVPLFWKFALATKVQFGAIVAPPGSNDSLTLLSDRFTPGGTAYDGIVRGYDDGVLTPDSSLTQVDSTYWYSDTLKASQRDPSLADSLSVTTSNYVTRVRGNYMIVANAEIQFPIVAQQVYGLFFFDAGNSWLHFKDIRPFGSERFLYKSAGFGVRIVVPGIGTLGFDFGKPFDSVRGSSKNWKPHFQIGTTFR